MKMKKSVILKSRCKFVTLRNVVQYYNFIFKWWT